MLQICLILVFFSFSFSKNLFYSLVYLFFFFIYVGLVIAYLGIDMFTGFFWVVELSVIFILLLFLFFLNYSGEPARPKFSCDVFVLATPLFFVDLGCGLKSGSGVSDYSLMYEDFYAALANQSMSDTSGLFISYYVFNSLLLVLFGLYILVISIVCVSTLRLAQAGYVEAAGLSLKLYSFFTDLLSFELLRGQDLLAQAARRPASRVMRRRKASLKI